jgi:CRISPR-associated protein Cas2
MRVILIYDIAFSEPADQRRLNKVRAIARRYIHHIQKSVFEGELSEAKLEKLKTELSEVVDKDRDMVLIYLFDGTVNYKRESLTNLSPDDGNIL